MSFSFWLPGKKKHFLGFFTFTNWKEILPKFFTLFLKFSLILSTPGFLDRLINGLNRVLDFGISETFRFRPITKQDFLLKLSTWIVGGALLSVRTGGDGADGRSWMVGEGSWGGAAVLASSYLLTENKIQSGQGW